MAENWSQAPISAGAPRARRSSGLTGLFQEKCTVLDSRFTAFLATFKFYNFMTSQLYYVKICRFQSILYTVGTHLEMSVTCSIMTEIIN